MKIETNKFRSEIPRLADHLLPDGFAKQANNCNTIRGELRPFRALSRLAAISLTTCKSLFQYTENTNDHWVTADGERHYAKSPISGDSYERVYFTGESEPRFFANDNISGGGFDESADYYKLGIPAPTTAPTVTTTGGGSTYRGYVYSFVNSYGEEGPPSPVGSDNDFNTGYVAIDDIEAAPADRAITKIYLYRTNASATGTAEFQYVLEATWFDATESYVVGDYVLYDDGGGLDLYKCTTNHTGAWNGSNFTAGENVANADLLSVFPKTNFDPPQSGLTNLISLANGSFCGFVGNTVYFSEPFLPHAWPSEYAIALDMQIVGLAADKNTIVIGGPGKPYIIYGTHPLTMTRLQDAEKLPLYDIRGIVSGNSGVFFVSKQGIVFCNGAVFTIITKDIIDPEAWEGYNYDDLSIHWYDKKLFLFDSVNENGFFIDFAYQSDEQGILSMVPITAFAHAGFVDDEGLFYIIADDTDLVDENNPPANMPLAVKKWEGATINYFFYTYQSKEYILNVPANFSAALIVLDQDFYDDILALIDLEDENATIWAAGLTGAIGIDGPLGGGNELAGDEMLTLGNIDISTNVTFKLYVDGTLRKTRTVNSINNVFRLPANYMGRKIYYELSGYVPVKRVAMATSMEELWA